MTDSKAKIKDTNPLLQKIIEYRIDTVNPVTKKDPNILIVYEEDRKMPDVISFVKSIIDNKEYDAFWHLYTDSKSTEHLKHFNSIFIGKPSNYENIMDVAESKQIDILIVDKNIDNKDLLYIETAKKQIPIIEIA